MKLTSKSVLIKAPQKTVWQKLIDWHTWPTWDGGMETISFANDSSDTSSASNPSDAIRVGSVGKLKMKGGPAVDLRVTEFSFEKSYTSEFDLWGSRFVFIHFLETVTISGLPQVRATVAVEADGITAPVLGQIVSYGLNKEMLGWLEKFRDLIEAKNGSALS
jgi:hypothetical protein